MPTDAALSIPAARAEFTAGRDYLSACTSGLPPRAAVAALRDDLAKAVAGHPDAAGATAATERARAAYASIVHVPVDDVAIAAQTSVAVSIIAAGAPAGAEILCVEGDFSSLILPFVHAGRGVRVRMVALDELAASVGPDTWLVAFSVVQSATGEVADTGAILAAARAAGARTLCDVTQAVGWLPVAAGEFDATVCHAYKWLCAPRGVAFLTLAPRLRDALRPVHAGWYAAEQPWTSLYGAHPLAASARRFDVSPAWQAFVGAAPALELFARIEPEALYAYTTGLARRFRAALDLPEPARPSAIVTWPDAGGEALTRLTAAGIVASGRAGRARVAFHVFNDEEDAARAHAALTG